MDLFNVNFPLGMMRWLVVGCMLTLSGAALGQSIELNYVEFSGGRLVVHYDLMDTVEGRFYSVRLYSSSDGFLNSVEKVSGDVGLEVRPGKDKKIYWDYKNETGTSLSGKLSIEIRGRLFVPFINTENISAYKVMKRNRRYNLTWSGGTPQNILNFDLMRGDKKVVTFPNLANVGHHAFEIPGYVRPGNNYHFRISDSKNKEDVVNTSLFRVRRKTPLAIKALAVAGFVAGVYMVVSGSSASSNTDIPSFPVDKLPK
ncbi:MAG: hypothetical protein JSS79_08640 [Bacteroidetes bacterium]|nr:hypothetical protein [Bacteroidota bacterium]